jgi:hypothetical protein
MSTTRTSKDSWQAARRNPSGGELLEVLVKMALPAIE